MTTLRERRLHLVIGAGGTKAVLAGSGAAVAFHVAGLTDFQSVGAASGGTIPAAVFASGSPPHEFLPHVVETDISAMLIPRKGLVGRMIAMLRKYHYERNRPRKGAFASRKVRRFVNALVPIWPERFWAVASCDHGQVLFTARGVFKYSGFPRQQSKLSDRPPSVGMAVSASVAMPGIIDSAKFAGELLYDGALSGDGEVPIDVVTRHFQQEDALIIAIDLGEDPIKRAPWLRALWTLFCGGRCEAGIDAVHPEERDGLILIKPEIEGFHALQFSLNRDQKWHAVISGFTAAAKKLCDNNLVDIEAQIRLQSLSAKLNELDRTRRRYRKGEFSRAVELVLREQGLFPRGS